MSAESFILFLIALKLVAITFGLPVAYSAVFFSVVFLLYEGVPISLAVSQIGSAMNSFTWLAIPMFMLAGKLMTASGIADRIFDFAAKLVGRIPGGLGHVNIVSSFVFAGMSGSLLADVAGLGEIEYKAMRKKGYDPDFVVGITLASSATGPILPPSLPMVLFGVAANVSITGLFLGGILPAFLIAACLMLYVMIVGIRRGYYGEAWQGWRILLTATIRALPPLLTPVIIVGGMTLGIFSPTEAATVAVFYALVIAGLVYRELSLEAFFAVLRDTVVSTSQLLFIVASALLFAWVLTVAEVPQSIATYMSATFETRAGFLLAVIAMMLVLGAIIENAILMLVLAPMLLPIAQSQFGIDPIHFGVVIVFNIMIGQFTPPIGLALFVMRNITGFGLGRISLAVLPFLIPLIGALLIMAFYPPVVLAIPRALGF
uniref:TRAP transporter large permease n=1 Tax=Pararhizobium sp. IMCC3301 TaxID=3067904 RepID=UPI0027408F8E|nr:TRAP transporter large permease [Pararhizobium sp. IMCC3301]